MADIRVLGLDIAKSVFQLHGVDAGGSTVLQKRLTRGRMLAFFAKLPPCLIGVLLDRDRGLRIFALLSPRADRAGQWCKADACQILEALCHARQERCGRCRSNLRGGHAALRGWKGRRRADAQSRLIPPDRENPIRPKLFECEQLIGTRYAQMASWPAALKAA